MLSNPLKLSLIFWNMVAIIQVTICMLAETGDLLGSLSDAWTFAGQGPSWRSPGQGGCRAQGGDPLNRAAAAEAKVALPGVGRR